MIDSQLGIAEETVFGTYVAPTRFYEFVSEDVTLDHPRLEGAGMRPGRRTLRDDRSHPGRKAVGGPVELEVMTKGFGLWLKHALGAISSAQPNAGGAPSVWKHTATLGALRGKSLTLQVGRQARAGTVHPFSYLGCKIASWRFGCAIDEILVFAAALLGRDESTAQSLAAASYPSSMKLLTFVEGSLTIGGTATPIREFSIEGDNALAEDDYQFGSRLRRDPVEPELRPITGTLDADFDDLVAYNRYVNHTIAELILLFAGDVIEGGLASELKITANVRFDGETPRAGGPGEIRQSLPFKVLTPAAGGQPITIDYQTTDTAP